MNFSKLEHEHWMLQALKEAQKAEKADEVPIGAVLVAEGKIIARAHNQSIAKNDPCAHAEILCLRRAGQRLKNYRLGGTILYVTVEPCAMCAGAALWARVDSIVYGCPDKKAGACGSIIDLSNQSSFNHHYKIIPNILEPHCKKILQDFFKKKRK